MIEQKTRWIVAPWTAEQEQAATDLAAHLKLSMVVTRLLVKRGYDTAAAAELFLYGQMEQLHDPLQLQDMDKAVARIQEAVQKREKIMIYGDYDADGVTSTALLIRLFTHLEADVDYYIPHREREGYGINKAAIDRIAAAGVSLIVTVDTGISAWQEVAYVNELGLDIIITDHHEPPEQLPAAHAVVNPKRSTCTYPFKGLAGVGVAYKLCSALLGYAPREWTDLVAIGTIADLMPLNEENRALVKLGLEHIQTAPSIGIEALGAVCGYEVATINSTNIAFGFAPRINAAGRLDDASLAVQLLIAPQADEATRLAEQLNELNKERQMIVEDIMEEAEQQLQQKLTASTSVIVLAAEGWNVGVIGIVASKLLERYYKPVIIFSIDATDNRCKGSARSIDGFDLYAALQQCDDLLEQYGGHQAAAGMSIQRDRLEQLEQRLNELATSTVPAEKWIPESIIDMTCEVADASLQIVEQLKLLEPFGQSNPAPKLLFNHTVLKEGRAIGKDSKHLKLQLAGSNAVLDAIGFNMGNYAPQLYNGAALQLVGELSVNEWNGRRQAQLQLHDIAMSIAESFPSREQFIAVYQYVFRQQRIAEAKLYELAVDTFQITRRMLRLIVDVFIDLQFIEQRQGWLIATAAPQKRELSSSVIYQRAQQRF